jgi:DNA polymerase (family 10)
MPREQMTKRIIKALSNKYVDIYAHPTTRKINQREPIDFDKRQVFKFCANKGIALEVDANPTRLDLNYADVKEAIDAGCNLVIDTDAHDLNQLSYMQFGVATARRGWAEAKNIINTKPANELKRFFHKLRD